MINILARISFYAFFALAPLSVLTWVYSSPEAVGGFMNVYAGEFLYLSDLVFVFALMFFAIELVRKRVQVDLGFDSVLGRLCWVFLALSFVSVAFAIDRTAALIEFFRLFQLCAVILVIRSGYFSLEVLRNVFFGVVAISSLFGIFQFVLGASLGLHVLGESVLSTDVKNVAKLGVGEFVFLRAYGLFPHPNVFAGFLVVALLLLEGVDLSRKLKLFLVALFAVALLLTFSRAGFLALLVALVVQRFSVKATLLLFAAFVLVLLFRWELVSYTERVLYVKSSFVMFLDSPFGVGLANFTLRMQEYLLVALEPWQLQPVHSVYLLILNEVGLVGFLLFIWILLLLFQNKKARPMLAALCVIALFDHYMFTLVVGRYLFSSLFLTNR